MAADESAFLSLEPHQRALLDARERIARNFAVQTRQQYRHAAEPKTLQISFDTFSPSRSQSPVAAADDLQEQGEVAADAGRVQGYVSLNT